MNQPLGAACITRLHVTADEQDAHPRERLETGTSATGSGFKCAPRLPRKERAMTTMDNADHRLPRMDEGTQLRHGRPSRIAVDTSATSQRSQTPQGSTIPPLLPSNACSSTNNSSSTTASAMASPCPLERRSSDSYR